MGFVSKRYTAVIFIVLVVFLSGCGQRQAEIHERGSMVMPFELSNTTHVFQKTDDGGLQQVVVNKKNDTQNTKRIQEHLMKIAGEFSKGNFSDPRTLHGDEMPGVAVLEAKHEFLEVNYTELPNGAQIMYVSTDSEVIAAVHDWFDAQLQDHGSDATSNASDDSVCDEIPEGHDPEMWRMHNNCP